jgi:hypothetical protein
MASEEAQAENDAFRYAVEQRPDGDCEPATLRCLLLLTDAGLLPVMAAFS